MGERIEIPESRSAKWLWFWVSVGFIALGVWLLTTVYAAIGIVGILFFGSAAFKLFRLGMDPRSRVILDETGIEDRTNGFGVIEWSDISHTTLNSVQGQTFINVYVHDEQKYLDRLSAQKQFWKRMNKGMGYSPITIPTITLSIAPQELQTMIDERITTR